MVSPPGVALSWRLGISAARIDMPTLVPSGCIQIGELSGFQLMLFSLDHREGKGGSGRQCPELCFIRESLGYTNEYSPLALYWDKERVTARHFKCP